MELAKEDIVFADINVTIKVFDIRDGDAGNKKSFLQMKQDISMLKEMKWKEIQERKDAQRRQLEASSSESEEPASDGPMLMRQVSDANYMNCVSVSEDLSDVCKLAEVTSISATACDNQSTVNLQ